MTLSSLLTAKETANRMELFLTARISSTTQTGSQTTVNFRFGELRQFHGTTPSIIRSLLEWTTL